jgi:NAD(P)-dependent dehydrogenase (short-subunit alcohol dehydrogenase family)
VSTLENKVCVVTGAARGIGKAIARRFVSDGARVVIADVDEETGIRTVDELGVIGAVRFVHCDVGDAAAVANLVDAAMAGFGEIDVLVNNAAVLAAADFLALTEADFDRVIRVNLKGAFLCGQAVARRMVERVKAGGSPGTIVNLSSVNAVFAIANQVPYSVSKGGINQLTKVMALALSPWGIRVNAIGPGSINTEMLASTMANPARPHRRAGRDRRRRGLSRLRRGELYHRSDHLRRRRPPAAQLYRRCQMTDEREHNTGKNRAGEHDSTDPRLDAVDL